MTEIDWRQKFNDSMKHAANLRAELDEYKAKYREAAELWDALELRDNQHVASATLLAKVQDFENNTVAISTAATDGCDWIDQIGLINTTMIMIQQTRICRDDD